MFDKEAVDVDINILVNYVIRKGRISWLASKKLIKFN